MYISRAKVTRVMALKCTTPKAKHLCENSMLVLSIAIIVLLKMDHNLN